VEHGDLLLDEAASFGSDAGRGNLLGIEPYVVAEDYLTSGALYSRLDAYLRCAQERGWVQSRTIVVLPEYLGTWLVACGESLRVVRARTLKAAMAALVARHVLRFSGAYLASREKDRATAAVFRMRAPIMAREYQEQFSGLARSYRVTLVAGSILLPDPRVEQGQITLGSGPLFNVTAVFAPDGEVHPDLVRKVYPIGAELGFVAPGRLEALPAFETPAGRLAVLICADSWYPAAYARLRQMGAELLAVPSAVTQSGLWNTPWRGYDGAAAPADVDPRDVGCLTEGEAWLKYALAGRMRQAGARAGINVFLRGALWDLGADTGRGTLVLGQSVVQGRGGRGALLNLWL